MACYKVPTAEYVYIEHFKDADVGHDVYSTFAAKKDAGDRFLYVFDLLKRSGWLPQKINGFIKLSPAHRRWRKRLKRSLKRLRVLVNMNCSTPKKNADTSDQYRSRGNDEFKMKNYEESLKLYTISIITADVGSANYAVSVANRSAALYHLEEYEQCLKDIEQALESDVYPSQNKYKLFERKGNCYLHTNRRSLALEMYSNCLMSLNNTQLPLAEREKINIRITECIQKCKETEDKTNDMKIKYIHFSESKNNNIPILTKFVEMKYSKEMGRGLFATKNIKPGEILIVEKPFAGVYKNNMWLFNCDYCFKRCLSAIPCPKCSQVLYCNQTCLKKAHDGYHGVECSLVYPLKGDPTVVPTHDLAVRCFLQLANAMGIDGFCAAVREYNRKSTPDEDSDAYSDVFRSVYALDGNEAKRTAPDMFFVHCTAAMVVSLLLLNDFRVPPDSLGTVGESLVHLLCVSDANSYASAERPKYVGGGSPRSTAAVNTLALVLCPIYSLINHSCDPNVTVQTHGGSEVTRAVQPISKGSQIFTDYGVNFMSHYKDERVKYLLDHYKFHCECQACSQNWPIYASLELNELYISNPPILNEDNQLIGIPEITLAKFNEILHVLLTQDKINVDCLDFLFLFLDLLYSKFQKPHTIFYKCIQAIKKCLYYTSDQIQCVVE